MSNILQFHGRSAADEIDQVLTDLFSGAVWDLKRTRTQQYRAEFGNVLKKRKFSDDAVACWLYSFDEALHRFHSLHGCLYARDGFELSFNAVVFVGADEGWGEYPSFMFICYSKTPEGNQPAIGFKMDGYVYNSAPTMEAIAINQVKNRNHLFPSIDLSVNPLWPLSEVSSKLLLNSINTIAYLTQSGWDAPPPITVEEEEKLATVFFEVTRPAYSCGYVSGSLAVVTTFSVNLYKALVGLTMVTKETAEKENILAGSGLLGLYLPWEQCGHILETSND